MSLDIAQILIEKSKQSKLHNLYLIEPGHSSAANQCLTWTYDLVHKILYGSDSHKNILNHPDVLILKVAEEKKSYQMSDMEEIFQFLHYKSTQFERKILIIEDASALSLIHINKLLKTFEEPPVALTTFLVNAFHHQLLPTLYSRSIKLKIPHSEYANSRPLPTLEGLGFIEFSQEIEKNQISMNELITYVFDKIQKAPLSIDQMLEMKSALAGLDQQMRYNGPRNTQLYTLHNCLVKCTDSQSN